MPKYLLKRRAVSAEIALFSCTISLILRAGTLISFARRYCDIPSGLRNSSERISPGCSGFCLVICGSW